jgi:hypothetical protein
MAIASSQLPGRMVPWIADLLVSSPSCQQALPSDRIRQQFDSECEILRVADRCPSSQLWQSCQSVETTAHR